VEISEAQSAQKTDPPVWGERGKAKQSAVQHSTPA